MFRALPCSPSEGQIVLLQHLVSSLSVKDPTVYRIRTDCSPLLTGVLYSTESHDTRSCNNTICPPEDEKDTARNMSRIMMQHMYCYRIKELCIKLVIWNKSILWWTVRKTSNLYQLFTDFQKI